MSMDEHGKLITLKKYADARVDKAKGVLICSTVDVDKLSPGNQVFPKASHRYDYPFYYYNLQRNAAARTNRFLQEQKK